MMMMKNLEEPKKLNQNNSKMILILMITMELAHNIVVLKN